MNLPDNLLDRSWYWGGWAVWVPVFAYSLWRAPWKRLRIPGQTNLWLGMIVALVLLWSLAAGVKPGLSLHLLGAMVFTLCCGPHLAFVGLSLVLAGVALNGASDWGSYGLNALIMAGAGTLASNWVFRAVERWLPKHFFIYIFINAFFGAALTVLAVGMISALVLALGQVYSLDYLLAEYLPYLLLLGFGEASLSGMIMTLFVIYRPEWVATFQDARYIAEK